MNFFPRLFIAASAGTGKTESLAKRLVELLRLGVRPEEIVALTFSRAAAGEIFGRFVTMLARTAAENPDDAKLLRRVIASQHLSQIGTLDAFLLRMLRAFPRELGLLGPVEMMDDYEARSERNRTAFSVLRRTDGATRTAFVRAFSLALDGRNPRSYAVAFRDFVSTWHDYVTEFPAPASWGDPAAIWGEDRAFAHVTARELAAAADEVERTLDVATDTKWQEFADWVRNYRGGSLSGSAVKGYAKKLLEIPGICRDAPVEFDFGASSRNRHRSFGGAQADAIRNALRAVHGYVIRQRLELARGVYTVISAFEKAYDERVRKTGKVVFSDIPRLIAALPEETRLALEFRMDAHLRAWALDEFQDTSRPQWRALANLLDEAKQGESEGKSLFVVGDEKQAIYGWREGDVGIFRRERASGAYAVEEKTLTYRSGKAVIEAVNAVFARGRIPDEYPDWECPEHQANPKMPEGHVEVAVTGEMKKPKMDPFVEPVCNALTAATRQAAAAGRTLSIAVLVRNNRFGQFLVDEIKRRGFTNIAWEGASPVADTPALSGFLDLVALADHPGDKLAYRHFLLTPLAKAKYPGGVPSAAGVSREMSLAFTTRGLVRTFRELRALFPKDPSAAWSVYTEERFTDFLVAASEFELGMRAGTRLADFEGYVRGRDRRNVAAPGMVRVMTIHHAKGLGFDYVILPLYEPRGLFAESRRPLVGENWILPDPGALTAAAVGGLDAAYRLRRDREQLESLAIYYVAMTRAKEAMTIVIPPAKPNAKTVYFADYVRASIPAAIGSVDTMGTIASTGSALLPPLPPPVRAPRKAVRRRLPSEDPLAGASASTLFAPHSARQEALRRGTAVHTALEKEEWWAGAEKPEGFVELWRERPFEVFDGGAWVSGRFDRVVFYRKNGELFAEVQDIKTGRGADADYEPQLAAYRHAVALLTGIPAERVTSRIIHVTPVVRVPHAHASPGMCS